MYTFYVDRAGHEVKHGPLYVWRWNYPIRYELDQRYRSGEAVHTVETTTNAGILEESAANLNK